MDKEVDVYDWLLDEWGKHWKDNGSFKSATLAVSEAMLKVLRGSQRGPRQKLEVGDTERFARGIRTNYGYAEVVVDDDLGEWTIEWRCADGRVQASSTFNPSGLIEVLHSKSEATTIKSAQVNEASSEVNAGAQE